MLDAGITPDRISLVATGHVERPAGEEGPTFVVAETGQRFRLRVNDVLERLVAELEATERGTEAPMRVEAVVTDWKEGDELVEREVYELELTAYEPVIEEPAPVRSRAARRPRASPSAGPTPQ